MFSLSRSTAALFGSALSEACTNLGSFITEEKEEDASVFVAAESQVQRWVVNRAGQKLTGEWDLAAGELAGVQSATVMDVAGVDSSRAAVLLAAPDDETGLRSFAVVVVAFGSSSEASIGKVDAVMKLGYKIVSGRLYRFDIVAWSLIRYASPSILTRGRSLDRDSSSMAQARSPLPNFQRRS